MLKILLVTILYIIVLFIVSPILDHAFSPLDEEETHLVSKLEYLTHKHPFRFLNIYED